MRKNKIKIANSIIKKSKPLKTYSVLLINQYTRNRTTIEVGCAGIYSLHQMLKKNYHTFDIISVKEKVNEILIPC